MKKTILIFMSLIFVSLISACGGNMAKNYTPDKSEYIEWDGNYFYFKNYRCTSDLKVEEPYITEITYNEKTYAIDEVNHCKFVDDKLHITFYLDVGSDNLTYTPERWSFYAIYSLKNKEVEYLYKYETSSLYHIDLNKILYVGDDNTIISGTNRKLSKIDITSNEIETIYCDSYEVKNGYKRYFNKPQNHMYYNRIDTSIIYFDTEKYSFIGKEEHDYDSKIILAEYGNIVYYVKTKRQGVYMAKDRIHYYLYQFDKTTQEEGLLNYFRNRLGEFKSSNYFSKNEINDLEIMVRNS